MAPVRSVAAAKAAKGCKLGPCDACFSPLSLTACAADGEPAATGTGTTAAGDPASAADGGGTGDDMPIFEVFRVVPQWVVRAERREAGYVACEARAFDEDQETALGLRLDGDGGFASRC